MTQEQKPVTPLQRDQKQATDSTQDELNPSSELGLKSPVKESERSSESKTNPAGVPTSPNRDDTPRPLGKESRNDQ